MTDIETRLARVESTVIRWKAACVALLACFIAAVVIAAAKPGNAAPAAVAAPVKVVDAQEFRVVGADGKVRATFSANDAGGAGLRFLDAKQEKRLSLGYAKENPAIFLSDAQGNPMIEIAGSKGVSVFAISDAARGDKLVLGAANQQALLMLLDRAGAPIWTMGK